MEERRKHHHFLAFRHSSFDISSSSDIMRLVPGSGHPQGGAPGGPPITPSCTAGPSHRLPHRRTPSWERSVCKIKRSKDQKISLENKNQKIILQNKKINRSVWKVKTKRSVCKA